MTRNSLLTALCAAALIYLTLTLVFSSYGILEYRRHNDYKKQLEANVAEMESMNDQLLRRIENLRTLSDVIVMEGRGIGLYRANEGIIRVEGYPNPSRLTEIASPGRMIRSIGEGPNHYPWIRAAALSAGLLVFAAGMVRGRTASRRTQSRGRAPLQNDPQYARSGREMTGATMQPRKVS
ncbi:MAG: hypothetical protein EA428_08460 [Spirochaetaceae bacterium]|nr:MAG: hypothetical protein EA428_08460 [Spirochaetaceae bacterium]